MNVEEKLDGTNVGIHFTTSGRMVLQCRGHETPKADSEPAARRRRYLGVKTWTETTRATNPAILEWARMQPWARAMATCLQDAQWHAEGDVWTHTQMATVRQVTLEAEIHAAMERRSGGGEWQLVVDGATVGQGGVLFHYNRPYGDLHMEITEQFRGQGLGSYLVQELKRACRALGAIPAAQCNRDNLASHHTRQKAGFIPCGHLLTGSITK